MSAVVRRRSLREPRRIHWVGGGVLRIETHRGPRGWWHQPHSGPRAQSTSTPGRRATRAQRRRRARSCRGCWAIAIRSDRADDHPGAWAPSVWPGARADSKSEDGYSCGDRGGNGKPRPRCHHSDGELTLDSGLLIDLDTEILFTQPSSELSNWQDIPPNLPLPPPLIDLFPFSMPSSLDFISLSAHPQLTICGVGSPLVCPSPAPLALSLEDPSTLPLASEAQTPPRSYDPASLPWLPAPSSPPMPASPPAPPGSLVPPAPPWSVISLPPPRDCTPLATPHPFVPLAPLGSSFPPAPPLSLRRGLPELRLPRSRSLRLRSGPPDPPLHPGFFGSLSQLRAPPAPPPLVGPMESAATSPPWFLPVSAPPWATIVTVAWVLPGSSYSKSLLPVSVLAPPSISTLDSVSRPPPEPPPVLSACLPSCQPFAVPCYHPTPTPFSSS